MTKDRRERLKLHIPARPLIGFFTPVIAMCKIEDFAQMELGNYHRDLVAIELDLWHRKYLPVGRTVLDGGAGCGETAQFYFNHGAEKIISIEADQKQIDMLAKNFSNKKVLVVDMDDYDILAIRSRIDSIKLDIEGAEDNMIVESHFPTAFEEIQYVSAGVTIWKLKKMEITNFVVRRSYMILRRVANTIRLVINSARTI